MTRPVRVVCLGEALIDLFPSADVDPSGASMIESRVGGAPLNVAVHLKRAGTAPLFLGALSSDSFGDRIRAVLEGDEIDHSPTPPVDAPTRLAVIENRESQPPFRFYGHRPADTRLSLRDVRSTITPGIDALYVSSLMMIDRHARNVQLEAIEAASQLDGVVVIADPNPRPSAWPDVESMRQTTELLVSRSWISKLSLDDARALGWPDEPEELFGWFKARAFGKVIVTDGPNGCWMTTSDGEVRHYRVPESQTVDSTGAGDAFMARIIANAVRDGEIADETMYQAAGDGARVAGIQGAF